MEKTKKKGPTNQPPLSGFLKKPKTKKKSQNTSAWPVLKGPEKKIGDKPPPRKCYWPKPMKIENWALFGKRLF